MSGAVLFLSSCPVVSDSLQPHGLQHFELGITAPFLKKDAEKHFHLYCALSVAAGPPQTQGYFDCTTKESHSSCKDILCHFKDSGPLNYFNVIE